MKRGMRNQQGMLVTAIIALSVAPVFAEPPRPAEPCPAEIRLQAFPLEAKGALDSLFAYSAGAPAPFSPGMTRPLVDFVSRACATDSGWELPDLDGAAGSAYIVKVKVPLQQYLDLNFHPGIPDYAVFPASLRYSTCLNPSDMERAYACITAGPTGTQEYATGRLTGMEEITPNPESGGYFSYTNSRTFLRCRVEGRDVLFSCSETLAPSTSSSRGVLIGPLEHALFYYSEKPGLNLTGMTWMLSQIRHSATLSVYIALSSNETAVATFAWLNAGWKGMNVTRACHILNSQRHTLDFSRRIAQHPGVSAPLMASLITEVAHMPEPAVNTEYEKYLAYVKSWRDSEGKGLFSRSSLLQELYDSRTSDSLPMPYRRALLVQERVRTLLGIPTWSANTGPLGRQ
ncbi:MAG: hypothetical protein WCG36_01130 [bacterium]